MRVSCRLHFGSGPCGGFSTLQPLRVLDPQHGGAVLALDVALDDRRDHVEAEHAIELVGGDLRLVALHEALAVAGPQRLPREAHGPPSSVARCGLVTPIGTFSILRDLAVDEQLLDLGLESGPDQRALAGLGRGNGDLS